MATAPAQQADPERAAELLARERGRIEKARASLRGNGRTEQDDPGDEGSAGKRQIVDEVPKRDGDSLLISDRPGIGIELAPDAAERLPYRPRLVDTRLGADGAVVDQ